ncbi:hypothetical protein TWF481_002287 [Arthrobotrys musiformis]|uniref:Uncharacterized protein n=1 Tax=Arthrobotrys musiformis TaxID=47236 RepID=A0AAV9VTY9_9PEZI
MAYSSNMLAHRGPVVNFSTINTITESTTILVRLEPDTITLDIPFNRVTTWNRLIQTLFDIYMRNNPGSDLTLEDALDNIKIVNDRTGGIILPELWPDFIKPQVRVAAQFNEPFLCPPWFPKFDSEIKREEDDIEMMEAGLVTCGLEPKLGGFVETVDWKQPNRLLGPPPSKADDIDPFHFLQTATSTVPASSFTFTSSVPQSWTPMETEKPRLRLHAGMNGSPLVSDVFAEAMLARRSVSREPTGEPIVERSASPPSISFRNPFPHTTTSGTSPSAPTVFPQRFTPVRQIPASDSNSRTPTLSPECSSRPVRDANPRPAKRKRDDSDRVGSSPMESCMEPHHKSRSPFQSSGSNGGISRAQSMETETSGQAGRLSNPSTRIRTSDSHPPTTMVIHRKLLLLDSIGAGELVKIVETKDGDLIVIRDDEEPEELMARRESNASMCSTFGQKEKEIGVMKAGKKRGHGEVHTEELVRIWSGCPEPPAKRPKAKSFDKLTVEQKVSINKFVKEQHIIRIDHFTNPVIQEWKARTIPEADPKQTEEYLEEIASSVYKHAAQRKEAYRLFMEHHNHSHKSSDARSSAKA